MAKKVEIKVGVKCRAVFKRHDGTIFDHVGVILRVWGKRPYAVTFADKGGPIRIGIRELKPLRK